jgi:Ca2+-binding EF-hand superfamily protein
MKRISLLAIMAAFIAAPVMADDHYDMMKNEADDSAHMAAKAGYIFKKLDTDGDGKITQAEYATYADSMFTAADTNGDGVVTLDELKALKKKEHDEMHAALSKDSKMPTNAGGEMSAKAAYFFKKIDVNGDGKITREEHQAFTNKMFAAADTNNDGALSMDEVKAATIKEADDMRAAMGGGKADTDKGTEHNKH